MQFEIPISTLFTDIFNVAAPLIRRYKVDMKSSDPYSPHYTVNVQTTPEEEAVINNFNMPVQFPMGINGGNYFVTTNGNIKSQFFKGCYLPFTTIASFRRAKRMSETYMSGQKGSVIENYGFEAWDITLQGFIIKGERSLVQTADATVDEQYKALQSYEEITDAIAVKGRGFEWRGISNIAIIDIDTPAARNLDLNYIMPFSIRARSVEPIELLNV